MDDLIALLDVEPHLGHPTEAVVEALECIFEDDDCFSVLDAGCGFGHAACAVASRFTSCRVVGIDAEPDVVARASDRARRAGVEARVRFALKRLDVTPIAMRPEFDVLLLLAAQQIYRHPSEVSRWMRTFVKHDGVAIVDRRIAVLPGLEEAEANRLDAFACALGPRVERQDTRKVILPRDTSLQVASMLMEQAAPDPRAHVLERGRDGVVAGDAAQVWIALYVVYPPVVNGEVDRPLSYRR